MGDVRVCHLLCERGSLVNYNTRERGGGREGEREGKDVIFISDFQADDITFDDVIQHTKQSAFT